MRRGLVIALLTSMILLAGLSEAADSLHAQVAMSGADLAGNSAIKGDLLAAYWDDVGGAEQISLHAERLHVVVYEFARVDTPLVQNAIQDRTRSFDVMHATAHLSSAPAQGWMGIYGESGLGIQSTSHAVRATGSQQNFGNAVNPSEGSETATQPMYGWSPTVAFVNVTGPLSLTSAVGRVAIKLMGPAITIEAKENTTDVETGTRPDSTVPAETISRWLLLSTQNGSVDISLPRAGSIALSRALAATDHGTLSLQSATGVMTSASDSRELSGQDASFTGTFDVAMSPSGAGSTVGLVASITGSVEASSIVLPRPAPDASSPWPLRLSLGVLVVAVVSTGAVVVAKRRQRNADASTDGSVEQMVDIAYDAADQERFAEALDWIVRARRLAPTSERLMLDEAGFRHALGQQDRALDLLNQACSVSTSGEADYTTAMLLVELGAAVEDVEQHLVRSLDMQPTLYADIESDAELSALRRRPRLASALNLARRRSDQE